MKSIFVKTLLDFYRRYSIHLLAWLLYIGYEMLSLTFAVGQSGNPLIYLAHYSVLIFFFYLNAKVTLPLALGHKEWSWWLLPVCLVLQTSCFIGIQYLVSFLLFKLQLYQLPPVLNSSYIWRNAYRAVFFTGFSTGYYFLTNYIITKERAGELEKDFLKSVIAQKKIENELVQAQNAFLKAQINPHLLFNTLDFIYHKVNTHSDQAGEAVIKLAEMMRFAIDSDQEGAQIELIDEIEQVNNLIYLLQLRNKEPVAIDFDYSQEVVQLKFIPLVLLTLVENMFKHGNLKNPESRAQIVVYVDQGVLRLYTSNAISAKKPGISTKSGLVNIYNRLVFAYTDAIEFKHQVNEDHEFIISIGVPIKYLT